MKATELMVRDWIADKNGEPMRVINLITEEIEGVYFGIDTDKHCTVEFEDAHPIPLTPEILEKNGIELLEVGDNGMATPSIHKNRYEKWFVHTQWRDTYLWFDRRTKEYHLHNMNGAMFTCVHELQHALRLCGIEKEITL